MPAEILYFGLISDAIKDSFTYIFWPIGKTSAKFLVVRNFIRENLLCRPVLFDFDLLFRLSDA